MFDSIAQNVTNAPRQQDPRFADRPALRPHNLQSLWAAVNPETGEVDMTDLRTLDISVGKTGAGLNNSIDRILDSYEKRGNLGYGQLEGFVFVGLGVTEVVDQKVGTLQAPAVSTAPAAPSADDQPEA